MNWGWLSHLKRRVRLVGRHAFERLSVRMGLGHVLAPIALGDGPHDCALTSLYWAVPRLPEARIWT